MVMCKGLAGLISEVNQQRSSPNDVPALSTCPASSLAHLNQELSYSLLRPLIASMATLGLNSGLWVQCLLNSFGEGFANGGSPFRGDTPPSWIQLMLV